MTATLVRSYDSVQWEVTKRHRVLPAMEANRRSQRALIFVALVLSVSAGIARAQDAPPVLRATTLVGRIDLDGRLEEAAWSIGDSIPAFTQTEPRQGEPATGRTVVRVLASPDALIIGVRADDPGARGIVSYAKQRDASLSNEDHIRLVLGECWNRVAN